MDESSSYSTSFPAFVIVGLFFNELSVYRTIAKVVRRALTFLLPASLVINTVVWDMCEK